VTDDEGEAPQPPQQRGGLFRSVTRGLRRLARHSAVRFLVVGGFSWLVDLGVLLLLVALGVPVWLSAAIAWSTGFITNYALNRVWSFGAAAPWRASAWRYLVLAGANAGTTVVVLELADRWGADLTITKTILTIILAAVNYFAYRFWVFAAPAAPSSR
jgi:putative flippase GtrA